MQQSVLRPFIQKNRSGTQYQTRSRGGCIHKNYTCFYVGVSLFNFRAKSYYRCVLVLVFWSRLFFLRKDVKNYSILICTINFGLALQYQEESLSGVGQGDGTRPNLSWLKSFLEKRLGFTFCLSFHWVTLSKCVYLSFLLFPKCIQKATRSSGRGE